MGLQVRIQGWPNFQINELHTVLLLLLQNQGLGGQLPVWPDMVKQRGKFPSQLTLTHCEWPQFLTILHHPRHPSKHWQALVIFAKQHSLSFFVLRGDASWSHSQAISLFSKCQNTHPNDQWGFECPSSPKAKSIFFAKLSRKFSCLSSAQSPLQTTEVVLQLNEKQIIFAFAFLLESICWHVWAHAWHESRQPCGKDPQLQNHDWKTCRFKSTLTSDEKVILMMTTKTMPSEDLDRYIWCLDQEKANWISPQSCLLEKVAKCKSLEWMTLGFWSQRNDPIQF